ncbi:hypothetical protein ACHAO7_011567 [Fusarium culmorum]
MTEVFVDFYGPSISCGTPKNPELTDSIKKVIANYSTLDENATYVGFVPAYTRYPSPTVVKTWEHFAIEGLHRALNYSLAFLAPTLDTTALEVDRRFGDISPAAFYITTPEREGWQAENTVKCELYNASYAINFTFNNGLQDIKYKTERLNEVTALAADDCRSGRQLDHCKPITSYFALMNAMGNLILGTHWKVGDGAHEAMRTTVAITTIIDSPDMHAFYYDKPKSAIKYMSMGDTLEELFTNITISLFSNSEFLQNDTAASYGPITRFSAQNAFSYEPRNLFIAYGIGILFSFIVVIYGLLCIKSSSESYTNSFSTILRTTRNPDLDTVIPAAETSGAEPLSKNLGNVRLTLRQQGDCLEGGGDKATFFAVDPKGDDGKKSREAAPTDSLLKRNGQSQHSDTDEVPNVQKGSDINLRHNKDNHAAVISND